MVPFHIAWLSVTKCTMVHYHIITEAWNFLKFSKVWFGLAIIHCDCPFPVCWHMIINLSIKILHVPLITFVREMFNAHLLVNVQLIYDQMMSVLSEVKHLLHASLQIKLSIEWLVTTSCIFNCYAWEALFALRTPSVFDTTHDISTAQFNF